MIQGKNINSVTLKELFNEDTSGVFPLLADIQHDNIIWHDDSMEQEDGHFRIINDNAAVKYKGQRFIPCNFSFTFPSEDGKKIGNTTITVSAIDQRIIEIVRSINNIPPVLVIKSVYVRRTIEDKIAYEFHDLAEYRFKMNNCRWSESTAQWDLVFDSSMQINVPIDMGTEFRNPAINKG